LSGTIGIKVDVDTFQGMRNGVPVLLDIFRRHDVRASFFVPMGKDNTGRTVKRVFTRKGFLKKAGRVGVLSTEQRTIRKSGRNTPEGRVRADFSKTWCKPLYGERSRLK